MFPKQRGSKQTAINAHCHLEELKDHAGSNVQYVVVSLTVRFLLFLGRRNLTLFVSVLRGKFYDREHFPFCLTRETEPVAYRVMWYALQDETTVLRYLGPSSR